MLKTLIVIILLMITTPAVADSMRCKSRLVSTGDTKVRVLLRCGEPFHKEVVGSETVSETKKNTIVERIRRGIEVSETITTGEKTVSVERWHYNFGKSQFMRILTFEGDLLKEIEIGDKP